MVPEEPTNTQGITILVCLGILAVLVVVGIAIFYVVFMWLQNQREGREAKDRQIQTLLAQQQRQLELQNAEALRKAHGLPDINQMPNRRGRIVTYSRSSIDGSVLVSDIEYATGTYAEAMQVQKQSARSIPPPAPQKPMVQPALGTIRDHIYKQRLSVEEPNTTEPMPPKPRDRRT